VSRLVNQLNEILADEWACVRTLRRAESLCDDPGQREVIKRVRKDCSVNCANLANTVRALGGGPTRPRLSIKSYRDALSLVRELHAVDIRWLKSAMQG